MHHIFPQRSRNQNICMKIFGPSKIEQTLNFLVREIDDLKIKNIEADTKISALASLCGEQGEMLIKLNSDMSRMRDINPVLGKLRFDSIGKELGVSIEITAKICLGAWKELTRNESHSRVVTATREIVQKQRETSDTCLAQEQKIGGFVADTEKFITVILNQTTDLRSQVLDLKETCKMELYNLTICVRDSFHNFPLTQKIDQDSERISEIEMSLRAILIMIAELSNTTLLDSEKLGNNIVRVNKLVKELEMGLQITSERESMSKENSSFRESRIPFPQTYPSSLQNCGELSSGCLWGQILHTRIFGIKSPILSGLTRIESEEVSLCGIHGWKIALTTARDLSSHNHVPPEGNPPIDTISMQNRNTDSSIDIYPERVHASLESTFPGYLSMEIYIPTEITATLRIQVSNKLIVRRVSTMSSQNSSSDETINDCNPYCVYFANDRQKSSYRKTEDHIPETEARCRRLIIPNVEKLTNLEENISISLRVVQLTFRKTIRNRDSGSPSFDGVHYSPLNCPPNKREDSCHFIEGSTAPLPGIQTIVEGESLDSDLPDLLKGTVDTSLRTVQNVHRRSLMWEIDDCVNVILQSFFGREPRSHEYKIYCEENISDERIGSKSPRNTPHYLSSGGSLRVKEKFLASDSRPKSVKSIHRNNDWSYEPPQLKFGRGSSQPIHSVHHSGNQRNPNLANALLRGVICSCRSIAGAEGAFVVICLSHDPPDDFTWLIDAHVVIYECTRGSIELTIGNVTRRSNLHRATQLCSEPNSPSDPCTSHASSDVCVQTSHSSMHDERCIMAASFPLFTNVLPQINKLTKSVSVLLKVKDIVLVDEVVTTDRWNRVCGHQQDIINCIVKHKSQNTHLGEVVSAHSVPGNNDKVLSARHPIRNSSELDCRLNSIDSLEQI